MAKDLHISAVANVAIPVSDAERALAFYVGVLGFEKRRDAPFGNGLRWLEVAPEGAVTTIALAPPGNGQTGVDTGIRLATRDCTADHDRLREQAIDVDDVMAWPGVPPMFGMRDPDGNTLYVVEQPDASV